MMSASQRSSKRLWRIESDTVPPRTLYHGACAARVGPGWRRARGWPGRGRAASLSHSLDEQRDSLAPADAGGAQAGSRLTTHEFMDEVRRDAVARGRQRVSERDRAAI